MANFLDADPQVAECIEHHRDRGQFVPIAESGDFVALVSRRHIEAFPVPKVLSPADYVVGLELLGFRFYVADGGDGKGSGLFIMEPAQHIPDAWYRRSLDLAQAYGHRTGETIDFLLDRDGALA